MAIRTTLAEFAESQIQRHADARDAALATLTAGVSGPQPDFHAVCRFDEIVLHGYFVEAWTTVLKRPHDSALVILHGWTNSTTMDSHEVARMVRRIKGQVAQEVIERLAKDGHLDEGAMRIAILGIHGID